MPDMYTHIIGYNTVRSGWLVENTNTHLCGVVVARRAFALCANHGKFAGPV